MESTFYSYGYVFGACGYSSDPACDLRAQRYFLENDLDSETHTLLETAWANGYDAGRMEQI